METFKKGRNNAAYEGKINMFKITVATDIPQIEKYMDGTSKGIMMGCYEEQGLTGGVFFDIIDGAGYIEQLKCDDEAMREVIAKAALNFLDINGIQDVYVKNDKFYKQLGFKEAAGDLLYLNLEGYFTNHEGGC